MCDIQINLFKNINNSNAAVESSRRLLTHFQSNNLLTPAVLSAFQESSILRSIHGFTTKFPLWKLACLLDEDWVEEDVLNTLAELLYFSRAVSAPSSVQYPSSLVLPTSFLTDARYLYQQRVQHYSANLIALRQRIRATTVESISFISWESGHYSSFHNRVPTSILDHGDSLAHEAALDVLPVFRWALSGLSRNGYSAPLETREIPVAYQGAASGSCAIAAHNFFEVSLVSDTPAWHPDASKVFRNKALRDLILYDFTAVDKGVRSPCISLFRSRISMCVF